VQWMPHIMATDVDKPDLHTHFGVAFSDGDGTVPLVALGLMCGAGWRQRSRNPARMRIVTKELPHLGAPGMQDAAADAIAAMATHPSKLPQDHLATASATDTMEPSASPNALPSPMSNELRDLPSGPTRVKRVNSLENAMKAARQAAADALGVGLDGKPIQASNGSTANPASSPATNGMTTQAFMEAIVGGQEAAIASLPGASSSPNSTFLSDLQHAIDLASRQMFVRIFGK